MYVLGVQSVCGLGVWVCGGVVCGRVLCGVRRSVVCRLKVSCAGV